MTICVCVGSSCHIKGSYRVITRYKELIARNRLGAQVTLKAGFCLGLCAQGIAMTVDSEQVTGLTPSNCDEYFKKYVLDRLKPG